MCFIPKKFADSFSTPALMDLAALRTSDDLSGLFDLNELADLHAIKLGCGHNTIYIYSGVVLIAIDPFAHSSLLYVLRHGSRLRWKATFCSSTTSLRYRQVGMNNSGRRRKMLVWTMICARTTSQTRADSLNKGIYSSKAHIHNANFPLAVPAATQSI